MITTAVAMGVGGIIWGSAALAFGLLWQSVIPWGYTGITIANLWVLKQTKHFPRARTIQVLISVLLPFLLQWSLGGIVPSGGVMIWALLSLIASMSFGGLRISLVWLGLFLVLVAVSVVIDPYLTVPETMNDIRVTRIVFAVNLSVVAGAVFGLTTAFLHLRYRLSVELAERNRQIAESQQALVQSEKMAALGRLSAGMAHELNNPASAAERGVSHLADAVERLRLASYELGRAGLEPSLLDRLRSIDDRAQRLARAPRTINAADRMDRETEIQDWLADRTPTLATDCGALVDLDFTTDALDDLLTAFGTATFPLVVERAVTWHTINVLLDDIGGGAKRVVDIVKALKSYTHLDQSPTQLVDIHEGLDDTLVMLNSLLREGITVRREYDRSIPRLTVHGGELNQVWTNIIENAAHAMDGEGAIVVRTFSDDRFAVVQIIDSGPGIPAHVADRVFDPFVTTKPVGQGTGLGLNICRNIVVEKHGGRIDVDSAPGRTCFEVRLPLST